MAHKLHISDDLSLPLDAATQTFAFIARKGAGKTYAAGKLTELLLEAGVQCVILDTVGNWYGLRLLADGKTASPFDIPLVGGLRGDLPLQATAGELMADVVVDTGRSLILDLSQFSLADRKRFATAFGQRLWIRKKGESHPSPVMLVIEESQLIVPQNVDSGSAAMVGIYEEIIRLGRNYGIGCAMISQRPQSVNKDVLNQTECLFVGQINGSQERDALKKWIAYQGMSVNLVDELPALQSGTMYAWSPQWLNILKKVHISRKITYDASATPKVGEKRVARELKPLDLDDLKQKMSATIELAKADDPRELKRRIADLERLNKATVRNFASETKPVEKRVEVKVVTDSQLERLSTLSEKMASLATQVQEALRDARQTNQAARVTSPAAMRPAQPKPAAPVPRESYTRKSNTSEESNGDLPKGERLTLTAIAQYGQIERDTLTILTGYKRSTRDAYIQRLRDRGMADVQGSFIVPTDSGIAALGSDYEPLPTGEDLRDYWMGRLPEGEKRVLEILIEAGGRPVAREVIDEATGYARSSRDAYIQRLGSRRLVETVGRGEVRAAETLFA